MIDKSMILGLDESHLVQCGDRHMLQAPVAEAFLSMQKQAIKEGIDLQIVSSFRNFERQLTIWNKKWQGLLPLYSLKGELLDTNSLNDEQKMHAILLWSALPGGSRHHWGTDLDVYDKSAVDAYPDDFQLVSEEYQPQGPCYALACWLVKNAQYFGFYLPYATFNGGVAAEPWHISFKAIADDIVTELDIDLIASQIEQSDMLGKSVVLPNLKLIFKRYTLNGI